MEEFILSHEDQEEYNDFVAEFSKKGLAIKNDVDPLSDDEVRSIINECYDSRGHKPPERVRRVPSPIAALDYASKEGKTSYDWCYGSMDANWLAFYMYFKYKKGKVKETAVLSGFEKALKLGWFIAYDDLCVVSDLPISLHIDEEHRLHKEDGPAAEYSDGFCLYYWHGISLNKSKMGDGDDWVITNPERITADVINKESNAELKRIMIEKIGHEKYLKISGAKPIHEDEYGQLYSIPMNNREEARVVRVENSTHNGDGSVDIYFIPVPPRDDNDNVIDTAEKAVKWTFPGVRVYSPLVET